MLRCGVVCRFFIINRTAGYGTSCGAFSFRKTETAAVLCILVRFFFFFSLCSKSVEWRVVVWCGVVWWFDVGPATGAPLLAAVGGWAGVSCNIGRTAIIWVVASVYCTGMPRFSSSMNSIHRAASCINT